MDDVHHVREIECPVSAPGPASVPPEELACAAVAQQSFNRILEIHDLNFPEMKKKRNGVNPGDF